MRFTQFAHNVAKKFKKNNDSLLVNSVRTIFFCHQIILTMLTFDKKILKLIVYLSINMYICTYNYAYHYWNKLYLYEKAKRLYIDKGKVGYMSKLA